MELKQIVAQECLRMLNTPEGAMRLLMLLFDINTAHIGAILEPKKSQHTINGYLRNGNEHKKMPLEDWESMNEFIEKYYSGKNPRKNLINNINRKLDS